jgi:hypothetical protein
MMRCILRSISTLVGATALLLLGFAAIPAPAQQTAVTITPNPSNVFNNGFGYSLGYTFSTTDQLTVTQLGFFNPRGLANSHEVGIFTVGGTLLASTTVPAGSLTTVTDPLFSYVPIAPL